MLKMRLKDTIVVPSYCVYQLRSSTKEYENFEESGGYIAAIVL